jgi:transposase
VAPPTARAIAGLIMRRPETLDPTETQRLDGLCVRCAELTGTSRLARAFATLVRDRCGAVALQAWLDEVAGSGIAELVTVGNGLRRDEAAVAAGLTLQWSSGAVEGHVTRIKLIARQMYGRATFDLLRRRVLLAS